MATAETPSRSCANHPDRAGHALCMSCRKTVCGECATTWEGINYCVACLARRRAMQGERFLVARALAVVLLVGLLTWGAAHAMVSAASNLHWFF